MSSQSHPAAPWWRSAVYGLRIVACRYALWSCQRDGNWHYEPVKITKRGRRRQHGYDAGKPARDRRQSSFGRYRLEVSTGDPNGPVTSTFDADFYTAPAHRHASDMLELALDKPEYQPGDVMTIAVTARSATRRGRRRRRSSLANQSTDVQAGQAQVESDHGAGLGRRRLYRRDRRPLDAPGSTHTWPRHRRAMVRHWPGGER